MKRLKSKIRRLQFLILNKIIIKLLLLMFYPYEIDDTPKERELTKKVIYNYFEIMCDEIEDKIY
jgi:hypothetical protein